MKKQASKKKRAEEKLSFGEKFQKTFDKIFGGFDLSWQRLVIFAVIAGIYTAVMALLPITKDTSFADISINFEVWVLFGIFIIMNSKSAVDSALKCFVFFLISQPLVYLIQVPFSDQGFELFKHYSYWFLWTLATPVMGFVGHFLKKGRWWGILILLPVLAFIGMFYYLYLRETIYHFPYHLLSAVFCFVTILLYPAGIFKKRGVKIAATAGGALVLIIATIMALANPLKYETTIMASGSLFVDVVFDDGYRAYIENGGLGEVKIVYDELSEGYILEGTFVHAGETELVLEDSEGNETRFDLKIGNDETGINRR